MEEDFTGDFTNEDPELEAAIRASIDQVERETKVRLIEQQDREYEEALEKDREKDRKERPIRKITVKRRERIPKKQEEEEVVEEKDVRQLRIEYFEKLYPNL